MAATLSPSSTLTTIGLPGKAQILVRPSTLSLAMTQQRKHGRSQRRKLQVSCQAPGNLSQMDDRRAVTEFLDMVRTEGSSWEELRKLAPQYQTRYNRFLEQKEQEKVAYFEKVVAYNEELRELDRRRSEEILSRSEQILELERQRSEEIRSLERELRVQQREANEKLVAAKDKLAEVEKNANAQIQALGNLVLTMEENERNSGMRLVIETMLRLFNNEHFDGRCSNPSCQSYLRNLVKNKVIAPTGTSTYRLLKEEWSKADAIEHYAVCPSAKLYDVYKDATGNKVVSVKRADLQAELAQRASLIWTNLHGPHHVLNMTSPTKIRIRYGPNSNRVDTLFYYSASRALKFDAEIVPESRTSSVREEMIRILKTPLIE